MFVVNELLKSTDENGKTERVLWIDENNLLLYLFDINSTKGFPRLVRTSQLEEMVDSGELIRLKDDPYIRVIDEEKISPKDKKNRERDWEIFGPYMTSEYEPQIFQRDHRGKIVKSLSEKYGLSIDTCNEKLRRGWRGGKNINAFLSFYYNSGGKGKPKTPGSKKLGRPKKFKEQVGEGINLDESIKRIFRFYIEKYFLNKKGLTLQIVFRKMIRESFEEGFDYENGIRMAIAIPEGERPSFRQFQYFYEKEYTQKETIIAKYGIKKYKKNYRPLLSNSNQKVWGPGSRYQIDATVIDIYLRSRFNRKWLVGRPVIYVIIDVFSRLIVAVYIGWEYPSWTGASMAVANIMADKVSFCRDYGIEITAAEWPSNRLPDAFLGDRGEWASYIVGQLCKLGIDIENTGPYRADWKGIVERIFRLIQDRIKPLIPGHVIKDYDLRIGYDYRLDAKLDIYQLTQIILYCIKKYNNFHWMSYYDLDEMQIEDDVDPIPVKLWEWGIKNRSGQGKYFPEDIVKVNLLPVDQATITGKGILYKNAYYSCETALEKDWFMEARVNGSDEIKICVDHRNMNYLYLRSEDGRSYEKCYLLDKSTKYTDKTFQEVENYLGNEKLKEALHKDKEFQADLNLDAFIEEIVNQATEQTDEVLDPKATKASQLKDIKVHQQIEREANREAEAFDLGDKKNEGSRGVVIPLHPEDVKEDIKTEESLEDDEGYKAEIAFIRNSQREGLNSNGQ